MLICRSIDVCPSGSVSFALTHWSLITVAGGTDIISCFMGQNVCLPVYRGEIQARNLGMAVEAWDEEGTASLPPLPRTLRVALGVCGCARARVRDAASEVLARERCLCGCAVFALI